MGSDGKNFVLKEKQQKYYGCIHVYPLITPAFLTPITKNLS